MNLSSKTALVTGASRGIGRAIAIKLAADGARVAVNFTKNEGAAQEVVAAIEAAGGEAFAVQGDVADLASIETLFGEVETRFGRLDILVNNAGIAESADFLEATPQHFDDQFGLNVRGLYFATQRALKILNDGGRIISISSIASRGLSIEYAAYGATKAAVNALTSSLSKGLGARGITVNAVSPGVIETDMMRATFDEETVERMKQGNAMKRTGQPEDIADVVAFLASDAARWITGREIVADGGAI